MSVKRYYKAPSHKSCFIFGPRGTGKSTWVKQTYPDSIIIDLLEPDTFRIYRSFPERFEEMILAHTDIKTFIVDEVQKAPELLSVVHKLIEMKKGLQFLLTGSSARKLKRSGIDLLAGRALLTYMHPFMASEIKETFELNQSIKMGMLPLIFNSEDPKLDLKTYIALYMREEVLVEGLVRRIDDFGRFLEVISFSQASVLNYSNIARDCAVSSKTIENYVTILEDLLLSVRLPIFDKRAKRELSSHPKFYYFDAGVYHSIRPKGPLDDPSSINGQALETLVMQHFRAWIDYSSKDGNLYYWRTRKGLEIDFIIYGEIGFYAFEVKNSTTIKPQDLRGLYEFSNDYPEAQCVFLYRGKEKIKKKNIVCWPLDNFLLKLVPDKPIIS